MAFDKNRLMQLLMAGAKGASAGSKSGVPELGLASGFTAGAEENERVGDIQNKQTALRELIQTPDFMNLSPTEKAFALRNPDTFLQENFKRTSDAAKRNQDMDWERKKQDDLNKHRASVIEAMWGRQANKAAQAEATLQVPGYKRTGTVQPKPEEAKGAREALGQFESLKGNIERLQELVKQHGSFEWGGEESAEMENLASDTKIILKELAKLGALTGPDMAILQASIQDPSSFSALFTRDKTAQGRLKSVLDTQERKLKARLSALGYEPGKSDITSDISGAEASDDFSDLRDMGLVD